MAQHDYDIANDTAASVRADLNNVLAAIVSNNSGASAPSTTYANQWWYDNSNDILKIRNEADTAWIDFATLDQTNGVWKFPTDATPDTDSTYDLGESSLKWANLYVDNVSDGTTTVGTEYVVSGSAKAWANLNGNGTIALRDSLNISGVTDNGTGSYTYSFSTAMSDANYPFTGTGEFASGPICTEDDTGRLSTAFQVRHFNTSGTLQDPAVSKVIVMGDLA